MRKREPMHESHEDREQGRDAQEPVPSAVGAGGAEILVSLRTWLDISPDAVIMIDQAGQMTLVHHQLETLFGHSRAELVGQPLEMRLLDPFRAAQLFHYQDDATAPHDGRVRAYPQVLQHVDIQATTAARLLRLACWLNLAPACFTWHFLGPSSTLEKIGALRRDW